MNDATNPSPKKRAVRLFGLGTLLLVGLPLWFFFIGPRMRHERLEKSGVRAPGRLLNVEETGTEINDSPELELTIEFRRADGRLDTATTDFVPNRRSLHLFQPGVDIVARYRPSREDALLCGDFYDVVQTPDRIVHVLIGDVAGHGPHEAALGAALRIAFRALTFAGVHGVERMRQLERVLYSERTDTGIFATVLSLEISPDSPRVSVIRAGHPAMLVQAGGNVEWHEPAGGPALGLHAGDWPSEELDLPTGHALLLLTDGLFEGYSGEGTQRLGEHGLLALARAHADQPGPAFVDALINGAQALAQPRGGLTDDIAVLRVERTTT